MGSPWVLPGKPLPLGRARRPSFLPPKENADATLCTKKGLLFFSRCESQGGGMGSGVDSPGADPREESFSPES